MINKPETVDRQPHVEEFLSLDVVHKVNEILERNTVTQYEVEGYVWTGFVGREGLGCVVVGTVHCAVWV